MHSSAFVYLYLYTLLLFLLYVQPDVTNFQEFMSQACKHGVKNTYCFEVWNGLLDPHGPTGVIVQQNYTVSLTHLILDL